MISVHMFNFLKLKTISFYRGYGFVRFSDENEHRKAMIEMQGAVGCGSKPLRVSAATPKRYWNI